MRWVVRQRLEFIEFRLFWEGKINRKDIMDQFGVSEPQASNDLKQYKIAAPGNMHYSRKEKHYYATAQYQPIFTFLTAKGFFSQLHMLSDNTINKNQTTLGFEPAFDTLNVIERSIDIRILQKIVRAMRNEKAIKIEYQSMTRPSPIWRWISPHAFAYDGFRWHVRAYCEKRNEFRDFIVGRIISIDGSKQRVIDPLEDVKWYKFIEVILEPHPDLTNDQKKIIEYEYKMENGHLKLQVRGALLYYLIDRFRLDNESFTNHKPRMNLSISNGEEIKKYI